MFFEVLVRDETQGGIGVAHPPTLKICRFAGHKTAVQCTSAGKLTGPRTVGELLLPEKSHRQKMFAGQLIRLPPPQKCSEITSLVLVMPYPNEQDLKLPGSAYSGDTKND